MRGLPEPEPLKVTDETTETGQALPDLTPEVEEEPEVDFSEMVFRDGRHRSVPTLNIPSKASDEESSEVENQGPQEDAWQKQFYAQRK